MAQWLHMDGWMIFQQILIIPSGESRVYIWVFPKIVVPQNGWFLMENTIKIDDLGVPLFLETPIYIYIWYKVPFLEFGLIPVDKYLVKEKTCLQPLPSSVTIVSI